MRGGWARRRLSLPPWGRQGVPERGGRACVTGPRGGGVLFCVPCPCERSEFVTPPAAAPARFPASSCQQRAGRRRLHPPGGAGPGGGGGGGYLGRPEARRGGAGPARQPGAGGGAQPLPGLPDPASPTGAEGAARARGLFRIPG